MSSVRINVQAPSNIALIKYMGKKPQNLPENASVSMTLKSLCSFAEVGAEVGAAAPGGCTIRWIPELPRGAQGAIYQPVVPSLKDSDISRVIRHVERVQSSVPEIFQRLGLSIAHPTSLTFKTANTFPAASGIASSASSFAAITLATAAACARDTFSFEKAWKSDFHLRRALAQISRQGSGSSCRSFEGPWVQWDGEETFLVDSKGMPRIAHFVVLIKTEPKKISSSEAHRLIKTSPLWQGRVERVQGRVNHVGIALQKGDLTTLAKVAWTEAWEMHSLFHTSAEPFSYWEPGTIHGLHGLAEFLLDPLPPIVTMDAGPNIHVLVSQEQREIWRQRLKALFPASLVLEDEQGEGSDFLGIEVGEAVE